MFSPFGLPSENRTAGWHPEPTTRGTFGLVSTCLITMSLCIWTAVHLNIPGYGERIPQYKRKVLCVLVGLFAPELMAWTAYEQYRTAQFIDKHMLQLLRQKPKPSPLHRFLRWVCMKNRRQQSHKRDSSDSSEVPADQPKIERHPWTSSHGQYVAMGGISMTFSHAARHTFPELPPRAVLRARHFTKFAEYHLDLLPDISESEIDDKSKASALAKALVCGQASWFCLQCIIRLSQGFTTSLLELNTFAHAMCAFLVYMLWWDKPLDIEEPTIMQGELFDAFQIGIWVPSELNAVRLIPLKHDLDRLFSQSESAKGDRPDVQDRSAGFEVPKGWIRKLFRRPPVIKRKAEARFRRTSQRNPTSTPQVGKLQKDEVVHGWRFINVRVTKELEPPWDDPRSFSTSIKLDAADIEKLRLLSLAETRFRPLGLWSPGYVRVRNAPAGEISSKSASFGPIPLRWVLGLAIAGLLYGGLHMAAWEAAFPTRTQVLLWRMSGIILVSSGLFLVSLNTLWKICNSARRLIIRALEFDQKFIARFWWTHVISTWIFVFLRWLCPVLLSAYGILYTFARIYLVVECFLTLGHLPLSVFEVPTWSQYMPHIT